MKEKQLPVDVQSVQTERVHRMKNEYFFHRAYGRLSHFPSVTAQPCLDNVVNVRVIGTLNTR